MKIQLGYWAFLLLPYVGLSQTTKEGTSVPGEIKNDGIISLIPANKYKLRNALQPAVPLLSATPFMPAPVPITSFQPFARNINTDNMPVAITGLSGFNMPVVSGLNAEGQLPEPMPGSFLKKPTLKSRY